MSDTQAQLERYRQVVLQRMRAKWNIMSDYMRNLPTYVFQDPQTFETITLSPNQAIKEVETLSDLGKRIIVAEAIKLQMLQP